MPFKRRLHFGIRNGREGLSNLLLTSRNGANTTALTEAKYAFYRITILEEFEDEYRN